MVTISVFTYSLTPLMLNAERVFPKEKKKVLLILEENLVLPPRPASYLSIVWNVRLCTGLGTVH